MKVVALVSGGKDSCYAIMKCIQYGHQIVALANLMPADDSVDELDSFMYQTVGHQIIGSYAECMGVPLFRRRIRGSTRHQTLNYRMTPGDEVEDMFILLSEVKRQIPSVTAVSSGAIASDYQRLRVESVCSRLGLVSLAYLWKQDQSLLLRDMIDNDIKAITVKVAAIGLEPAKHLGKEIAFLEPHLHKLKELYGINVCGEGGEYETLTLDCPLFINARIVLGKYQIALHSPDSIASVGVIHPQEFHLESKEKSPLFIVDGKTNASSLEKPGSVFEVEGDCPQTSGSVCQPIAEVTDLVDVPHQRPHISKTKKDNIFSMCYWLQESYENSSALEEDLKIVLKNIESQLAEYSFGWEHVLYIHLYISSMQEFTSANETYVKFITQEKCPFGVPSRSTIELPLLQAGMGRAYVEVLVANDNCKNVLHVQSVSCWAPSCIGPYSQATLHKEILYMAGQLGLDPPTMNLCSASLTAELEQALKNSEAVAGSFNSSISTSAVLFSVYCSARIPLSERHKIQESQDSFLKHTRLLQLENGSKCKILDPIFLYVLVPDLPKSALLEVKPILFVPDDSEIAAEKLQEQFAVAVPNSWGFQHAHWHDSCIQKCVVGGKICAILVSITKEIVAKICSESQGSKEDHGDHQSSIAEHDMERISRFCIYLLDRMLMENGFSWEDTISLRIYYPTSLSLNLETLSTMFTDAFNQLAETGQRFEVGTEPIFNIVPVLGAGSSAACMDDIITCELFSRKS
ncbi:hypothetical protein Tsubulata_023173 [Turnera subulata]|uniref:Diphthine--ammonia ligase n=1 Tax=Turnera subulata TaxID=218843 RepID=A0A9Q0FVB4_9ROSI|nr:hypothetical protein Tsubulata_023173 [Turnera subulata]